MFNLAKPNEETNDLSAPHSIISTTQEGWPVCSIVKRISDVRSKWNSNVKFKQACQSFEIHSTNVNFQWTHFLCCRYFFDKTSESYEISIIKCVTQFKNFMWNHCFHSWQLCALYFFNSEFTSKINKITNKTNKITKILVFLSVLYVILLIFWEHTVASYESSDFTWKILTV
jgi:hypothetical protein